MFFCTMLLTSARVSVQRPSGPAPSQNSTQMTRLVPLQPVFQACISCAWFLLHLPRCHKACSIACGHNLGKQETLPLPRLAGAAQGTVAPSSAPKPSGASKPSVQQLMRPYYGAACAWLLPVALMVPLPALGADPRKSAGLLFPHAEFARWLAYGNGVPRANLFSALDVRKNN